MKCPRWFGHSNSFSHPRIAAAGSLLIAGLAIALVAAKTSSPTSTAAMNPRNKMWPLLAMGPRVTPDGAKSLTGPGYYLFGCQHGVDPFGRTCYDPFQMRHAYEVDSLIAAGYDGTGQTIVIIDAFDDPFLADDLAAFDTIYGLPTPNFTQIYPDGPTTFDEGWAGEMTLDVEWSHAIAPGANIVLVHALSNSDADLLSAIKYAVDNNLGDVISMSFGEAESCVGRFPDLQGPDLTAAYHDVFAEATQKGITLLAGSGDQGASQPTCDVNSWIKSASAPANDPLVTAVGGTELHATGYPSNCTDTTLPGCSASSISPRPGTYQGEIAWNEGPPYGDFQDTPPLLGKTFATGGGFSVIFDQPPYQRATLPNGMGRGVPDVAYNAAIFHGVLIQFLTDFPFGGTFVAGGTSAGSPQWAALTAITNQKAGHRLGFLNSAIYQIGRVNKAYPASFHDIVSGNNSAVEFDSMNNPVNIVGFSAGNGWDPTTGLGSPIEGSIADNLIKYVSPGDGQAAIATSKPKPHPRPVVPGHMNPH